MLLFHLIRCPILRTEIKSTVGHIGRAMLEGVGGGGAAGVGGSVDWRWTNIRYFFKPRYCLHSYVPTKLIQ